MAPCSVSTPPQCAMGLWRAAWLVTRLATLPVQGHHVARLAADLRDLLCALELEDVTLVGASMGAAVIWSYFELFGSARVSKAVFVDQAPLQVCWGWCWGFCAAQGFMVFGGLSSCAVGCTASSERILSARRVGPQTPVPECQG